VTVAVERRLFDPERDVRLYVALLSGDVLFEAVAVRGFDHAAPRIGSLKLLPVVVPWPEDVPAAEHPRAQWRSVGELARMRVVEP
jgi:hypothetical protein